jgi:hypothetical protein
MNEMLSESDCTIKAILPPIEMLENPMPLVHITDQKGYVSTLDFVEFLVWELQPLGDVMNFILYQLNVKKCSFEENILQWFFSFIIYTVCKLMHDDLI